MLHKDPTLPIDATLPTLPKLIVGQPHGDAVPDAIAAASHILSVITMSRTGRQKIAGMSPRLTT